MLQLSQRVLLIGAAALCLLFCAAWVTFALSKPGFETVLPRASSARSGLRNLALFDEGLVVRVSSNERPGRHHPAYALDGHPPAIFNQKWLSAVGDNAPWIEVRFHAPHSIEHIALRFTSHLEPNAPVPNVYALTCIKATGKQEQVPVRNNTDADPTHPLPCKQAEGIRIDFPPHGQPAGEQVGVMELQVWGQ